MTLYDALGVSPDANGAAIGQAYKRLIAEFAKDTTAPDPRREALIRTAHETLLDPARRAEYDASLAAQKTERVAFDAKRLVAYAIAGIVILAGAIYFITRKPAPPPLPPARAAQEILAEVTRAIGRVRAIEMSGTATQVGLAFANGVRTMATTCHGLVASAQIVVTVEKGDIGARISIADEELGICKLAVDASGVVPLPIATAEAKTGDRVFASGVNAAGQVTLAEGSVKGIVVEPRRRLIELAMPGAIANGAPVLDTQGNVVGVVTLAHGYGAGRNLALPAALVNQAQSREKKP